MRGKYIILIALYALSVVVRIYPVFVTPLPYNVDALTDARASHYIADHGNIYYPKNVSYNNYHTPVTPFFNALSGMISQMTGVAVLKFIPYIFPFIVSLGVIGWYLLAKRITKKEEIAILTGIIFALSGTYVHETALIWKQAIGMTLMPFILYTFKKRNSISLFFLSILPLVHHYVALITYMIITYHILYDIYLKNHDHIRFNMEDKLWLGALPVLWIYFGYYYSLRHFDRLQELSPGGSMWLFISIFILLYILSISIFSKRYSAVKFKYYLYVSIPVILFYIIYFFFPIFPHTMMFNTYTFIFTLGYILLLPLITMGLAILFFTEYKNKNLYLSPFIATLHMLLFFFLRGFDFESYASLSRTIDFGDISYNTAISTSAYKMKYKTTAFVLVFLIVASTTPLTYFTMESFGVNFFIQEDEYHAAQWIKEDMKVLNIESDDRLALVAHNGFDINSTHLLPYELDKGIRPTRNVWLVSSSWEYGAQISPMAPVTVNVNSLLNNNSVVFSTGRTFVVLNNTS